MHLQLIRKEKGDSKPCNISVVVRSLLARRIPCAHSCVDDAREGDGVSTPPTQEPARDITLDGIALDPPSFTVPDRLLDFMAADEERRHLAAVEKLEETRKITRAEAYLRNKLRCSH